MQSPMKKIRQRLAMSTPEFARLCGVSNGAINFIEHGTATIPQRAIENLGRLGIDTGDLQREHTEFMAQRLQALREQAAHAMSQ